ncbi:hypothetical protein D3C80_1580750 [compost metagenome]
MAVACVAQKDDPTDVTLFQLEGKIGRLSDTLLQRLCVRVLHGHTLQRLDPLAVAPLQQLAVALGIGRAQHRIALLDRHPGILQTLRQVLGNELRLDPSGIGNVIGAAIRLQTLKEPERLLVIRQGPGSKIIGVQLQPLQNFGVARMELGIELIIQRTRRSVRNDQLTLGYR